MPIQSIYNCKDYRQFIKSYYLERKDSHPSFSLKHLSKAAGLRSPNYIKLIMDGQRNLTISNIHGIAKALSLQGAELDFFETLVLHNQSSTSDEKRYYEARQRALKAKAPLSKRKMTPTSILAQWYYPALLLYFHDRSKDDAIRIAGKELRISATEIEASFEFFKQLGLIVDNGIRCQLTNQQLSIHDPKALSQAQKAFLLGQIQASLREFQRQYAKGSAKFVSHALTVPNDGVAMATKRLLNFLEELTKEMDQQIEGKPFRVLQFNTQIFFPSA